MHVVGVKDGEALGRQGDGHGEQKGEEKGSS
jgi:hypothetical protein